MEGSKVKIFQAELKFHAPSAKCSHLRLGTSEGSSEEPIFRAINSNAKVQTLAVLACEVQSHAPFLRSSESSDSPLRRDTRTHDQISCSASGTDMASEGRVPQGGMYPQTFYPRAECPPNILY